MDFSGKAQSLADKMNELTSRFDLSEEMVIEGEGVLEIAQMIEQKTDSLELMTLPDAKPIRIETSEIINLKTLVDDFKYIRETLKETTDNGRRVLNSVTLDLLDSDDEKRAALILSFAELNKAVGDNMRLYVQSYKDISTTLININKIASANYDNSVDGSNKTQNIQNNTVIVTENISTADLLQQLRSKKEK